MLFVLNNRCPDSPSRRGEGVPVASTPLPRSRGERRGMATTLPPRRRGDAALQFTSPASQRDHTWFSAHCLKVVVQPRSSPLNASHKSSTSNAGARRHGANRKTCASRRFLASALNRTMDLSSNNVWASNNRSSSKASCDEAWPRRARACAAFSRQYCLPILSSLRYAITKAFSAGGRDLRASRQALQLLGS